MRFHAPQRRLVSWIGILLILLNVLAPTVAHAVRGTGGSVSTGMADWCSAPVFAGDAMAGNAADPGAHASDDDTAPRSAGGMLCPFCAGAPAALALASNALILALEPTPVVRPGATEVAPHAADCVPRTGQPRAPPAACAAL